MNIKIFAENPAYVLLHILIMSSCIMTNADAQQNDKNNNFVTSNNKKFISINQTEQDEIAKVTSKQDIFIPHPTIASQRANIAGYSNVSYKKKVQNYSYDKPIDKNEYSDANNNYNAQNNINTYSAVNTFKKPQDKPNQAQKNYTNIKNGRNDADYNTNQTPSTAVATVNNYEQQEAVIPFIVDAVQYKQQSSLYYTDGNKYAGQAQYNQPSYSTSNTNYPDSNAANNYSNSSISNVISTYSSSIPTNINNQNAWVAVDNASNNSNFSNYALKTYSTISNAAGILLNNAKSLLGIPYRYGGNTPNNGLDCSGFVRYVYYYTLGVALPRRSAEIGQLGISVNSQSLKAGDLVFFNTRGSLSHLGIYMGNGSFIHAPSTGSRIRIDSLGSKYWSARYEGAKRIVSLE